MSMRKRLFSVKSFFVYLASNVLFPTRLRAKKHSGKQCFRKRSVYRLGRFGQMVSKFPCWENSVRDWRLPFAEIPTIYQKICTTATANEKVAKQKLWLTKQRLCTCVIFGIFLCRSVHNYNVKWPNSTFCVERKHTTVNFRFNNNNK